MSFQAQPATTRSPKQRSALANGSRPFLVAVPGSTEAARHYKFVLDEIEAERGGRAADGESAGLLSRAPCQHIHPSARGQAACTSEVFREAS